MEQAEGIDFAALERELRAALEADRRYQRENDAKFRAVRQQVGSYEEFRDIVLASHLKPLERKDKAGAPRKQPWNSLALGSGQKELPDYGRIEESEFQPRTAAEFNRDWRRCRQSSAEKYRLLLALGGEQLGRIFSTEIGFGLLGEFLLVLSENFTPGDEVGITEVLRGLAQTQRFSLNVAFLSQTEREGSRQLFEKLLAAADTAGAMDDKTLLRPTQDNGTEKVKNTVKELRDLMQLYKLS
uniref:Coiled-coil domain containing 103 n=2 Tax=Lepisosteus oculatus TaxID=7918 RepID=W5N3E1_LEPOC